MTEAALLRHILDTLRRLLPDATEEHLLRTACTILREARTGV